MLEKPHHSQRVGSAFIGDVQGERSRWFNAGFGDISSDHESLLVTRHRFEACDALQKEHEFVAPGLL